MRSPTPRSLGRGSIPGNSIALRVQMHLHVLSDCMGILHMLTGSTGPFAFPTGCSILIRKRRGDNHNNNILKNIFEAHNSERILREARHSSLEKTYYKTFFRAQGPLLPSRTRLYNCASMFDLRAPKKPVRLGVGRGKSSKNVSIYQDKGGTLFAPCSQPCWLLLLLSCCSELGHVLFSMRSRDPLH